MPIFDDWTVKDLLAHITAWDRWELWEMSKTHPDLAAAYLEKNQEVLAAHVIREVNSKLRTGLREGRIMLG